MLHRLQSMVRMNDAAPAIHGGDLEDIHEFTIELAQIFEKGHGDCVASLAIVEIRNQADGYTVGHVTWDLANSTLRFKPCVPDDTQPLPIQP